MTIVATGEDGGVDWRLELDGPGVDGDGLLPGRLVEGRLTLHARKQIEARGLIVALRGTEHWQYTRTTSDGKRTRTETVTRTEELPGVPLQALGAVTLVAGATRELPISLPVPSLGPASLDAVVAGVRWILEAKLDVPSGFDSSLEAPIRIHQPTALLRAGVVRVEQFALWEAARGGGDHAHGELELTPMPLCLGQPFEGELRVHLPEAIDLQEVRLEFRVNVRATVSSGRQQLIEAWRAQIVGPGRVEAGDHVIRIAGQLPPMSVPTIQLPHGRSDVMARIVFARAWARDHHIDRDISFCTTTAL